jgi:hypothetical protein
MSTNKLLFKNESQFPVMVESWIVCGGVTQMKSVHVEPFTNCLVHSCVGEWHIHSYLLTEEEINIWKENGVKENSYVGKFRSEPCSSGNYSWMDVPEFYCVFEEEDITENTMSFFTNLNTGNILK